MKSLNCLTNDCIGLIHRNRMLQPLIKAELVQKTLEEVYIEPKIKDNDIQSLIKSLGLIDDEKKEKWLKDNKLDWESFVNIALRNSRIKEYCNLNFSQKLESHFLERSLVTIFNSNVQSSYCMDNEITNNELKILEERCILKISTEFKLITKIKNFIIVKSLYVIYKILKIIFKFNRK